MDMFYRFFSVLRRQSHENQAFISYYQQLQGGLILIPHEFLHFRSCVLAFAITCSSLESTLAASTVPPSPCQTVCRDDEYRNETYGSPSCTPCLNCAEYRRERGRESCASSVEDCGELDYYEYDDKKEGNLAETTGLEVGVDGQLPTVKPGVPTNKYTDDAAGYVTPILASAGILAAIVVSLVCALGLRRCLTVKGVLSALLLCCL